ncbi:uncharacterized protein K460DRAFT_346373 [Cucurbitaria berberidis CBS 394.84]|uniref:Uncharacterized protein n=1 Tax=Cucurbitaria berberidis CBS 394.84 TaxID=1168544 RepID=A0A9P4L5Y3_9PLEO|nr:uncharacterized protein K460DRAFT_346373 [Cucurbitaria berberidis CBS 394.84]KAF1842483.1 hypothetical protein K460DRAFT_346373 [Cucurbitaria berberidis CBS 394.84]
MPILPNPPGFQRIDIPWSHRPAEYVREPGVPRGWYQDGRKLHHVKASKAFIWPKDGKNGSTWGRMKDILKNRGPDIHVAFAANKADCVSNRPPRAQWSRHTNLDDRDLRFGFNSQKFAPWTNSRGLGGRMPGMSYDFRTRKYGPPYSRMWTDAVWQQEPYKNRKWNTYPEAVRMWDGSWLQDRQYMPQSLNGPTHNEYGRGIDGFHLPYGPLI